MAFAWQLKEELAGNDGDITGAARGGRGAITGAARGGEGGRRKRVISKFKHS